MTLLLSDEDHLPHLRAELLRHHPGARCQEAGPRLLQTDAPVLTGPPLMFVRQALPEGLTLALPSINAWARAIVDAVIPALPDAAPWRLHIAPLYGGDAKAGANRAHLILTAVREQLQKRRRSLLRALREETGPFDAATSLVQLLLTAPDAGTLSLSIAPQPHHSRHLISAFPAGELPVAQDKSAPSRAFAKLVEAQLRLGRTIAPEETVIDLGACPGGWTYVAVQHGARVIAVDRTELREDLMHHPHVRFIRGDAFSHRPAPPVDWMICDVIAAPERNITLLENWVRQRWMRHFVVSIKFKGEADYPKVDALAQTVAPHCSEFRLLRLNANKNEACATGTLRTHSE